MTLHDTSTPILILQSHGHSGLNIMKSLGPLGVEIYNLHPNRFAPAHYSRYCRGRFFGDIENSPAKNALAYLEAIQDKIGQKLILIPTTDATARFVDRWQAILRDRFIFPQQPAGLVDALCSKKEIYRLTRQSSVPTPECSFPTSRAELWEFMQTATFPVVLKGIDGQRLWDRTGRKMFIVRTPEELIKAYARAEDPACPNLMLQEYIPGGDDNTWMFGGYFNHDSEELVRFTGRQLRQFPVHTGPTSLGVCLPNPEVSAMARRFVKALGFRGIMNITFRYDPRDGQYKLLDFNPRIGPAFRLFVGSNGIDVARALYCDLTGQRVVSRPAMVGRKWIAEDLDVAAFSRQHEEGVLTFRGWLNSLRGIDEAAFFSRRDPLPFFMMGLTRTYDLGSRLYRKMKAAILQPRTSTPKAAPVSVYPRRSTVEHIQSRKQFPTESSRPA